MSELILTRGIPASGKTTWAKAWVAESPATRLRVNRDDLRRMLHGVSYGLNWEAEQAITGHQQAIVTAALADGIDVVVDDTNLRARYAKVWFAFSETVTFQDFPVDVATAIERDGLREFPVGREVIEKFAARFLRKGELPPAPERPEVVVESLPQYRPDDNLDPAVMADLDGTLAHIREGGRSPFDGTRVLEDGVDRSVARIVNSLGDTHHVILMTGRMESCRADTEKWLLDNNIRYDALHMRATDDTRGDDVIKLELFDAHVRGKFNVIAVLDDRDRVVRAWRGLGLKCFQVQPGNF